MGLGSSDASIYLQWAKKTKILNKMANVTEKNKNAKGNQGNVQHLETQTQSAIDWYTVYL